MRRSGGDAGLLIGAGVDPGWPAGVRPALPAFVRPSGQPYGEESGRDWPDNDVRFGRFASAAAELAMGTLDINWAADPGPCQRLAGRADARLSGLARLRRLLDPDHPQRSPTRACFRATRCAGSGRRACFTSTGSNSTTMLVPQGRPRLRLASDHRQRHLAKEIDARGGLRARRPAAAPLGCPRN